MKKIVLIIPFILTLIISSFLLFYLLQNKDPKKPPSALLNEDVPKIKIPDLFDEKKFLTNIEFNDKLILVNFFASWCAPCKIEHPLLFKIKSEFPNVFLLGINHKDNKNEAIKYLNDLGDPYNFIGLDNEGKLAIEFGVIGLPETFVVNTEGKIIYKHLGPIEDKVYNEIKSLLQ